MFCAYMIRFLEVENKNLLYADEITLFIIRQRFIDRMSVLFDRTEYLLYYCT